MLSHVMRLAEFRFGRGSYLSGWNTVSCMFAVLGCGVLSRSLVRGGEFRRSCVLLVSLRCIASGVWRGDVELRRRARNVRREVLRVGGGDEVSRPVGDVDVCRPRPGERRRRYEMDGDRLGDRPRGDRRLLVRRGLVSKSFMKTMLGERLLLGEPSCMRERLP